MLSVSSSQVQNSPDWMLPPTKITVRGSLLQKDELLREISAPRNLIANSSRDGAGMASRPHPHVPLELSVSDKSQM